VDPVLNFRARHLICISRISGLRIDPFVTALLRGKLLSNDVVNAPVMVADTFVPAVVFETRRKISGFGRSYYFTGSCHESICIFFHSLLDLFDFN
jgi:hypothetical protein